MKMHLTVKEMLIWHDQPQLFVATDKIGGLFLCLAVDDTGNFISVAISAERLQQVQQSKFDLYTVFTKSELGGWLMVSSNDTGQLAATQQPADAVIPSDYLPEPDTFLPSPPLLNPELFSAVKVSAVAKEANMNPTLLRQYIAGVKNPSPEQARRVQDALHRLAERLLSVHFV